MGSRKQRKRREQERREQLAAESELEYSLPAPSGSDPFSIVTDDGFEYVVLNFLPCSLNLFLTNLIVKLRFNDGTDGDAFYLCLDSKAYERLQLSVLVGVFVFSCLFLLSLCASRAQHSMNTPMLKHIQKC